MAAREASSASAGLSVPARKASTSEQASPSQGWSVTGTDATGNDASACEPGRRVSRATRCRCASPAVAWA